MFYYQSKPQHKFKFLKINKRFSDFNLDKPKEPEFEPKSNSHFRPYTHVSRVFGIFHIGPGAEKVKFETWTLSPETIFLNVVKLFFLIIMTYKAHL